MPLYPPFVGQMSRQLDAVFVFYGNFCKSAQKDEEKEEGKMKKLSQFLKSHVSGMLDVILL